MTFERRFSDSRSNNLNYRKFRARWAGAVLHDNDLERCPKILGPARDENAPVSGDEDKTQGFGSVVRERGTYWRLSSGRKDTAWKTKEVKDSPRRT